MDLLGSMFFRTAEYFSLGLLQASISADPFEISASPESTTFNPPNVQRGPFQRPGLGWKCFVVAGTLFAGYVLSFGPVMKWSGGPFQMSSMAWTLYAPLAKLHAQNGLPACVIRSYLNLWGIRIDLKTGELKD